MGQLGDLPILARLAHVCLWPAAGVGASLGRSGCFDADFFLLYVFYPAEG